jgi:transposase
MGKSRGGLSTKIHAAVDALVNPVRLLLTPGQASEYGQAEALIEGFAFEAVLADKGYDSDAFVEVIQRRGAEAVIPSKKKRLNPRSLVERFFQKLKQFHRIVTRYERLARNCQSMQCLVSAVIWLA